MAKNRDNTINQNIRINAENNTDAAMKSIASSMYSVGKAINDVAKQEIDVNTEAGQKQIMKLKQLVDIVSNSFAGLQNMQNRAAGGNLNNSLKEIAETERIVIVQTEELARKLNALGDKRLNFMTQKSLDTSNVLNSVKNTALSEHGIVPTAGLSPSIVNLASLTEYNALMEKAGILTERSGSSTNKAKLSFSDLGSTLLGFGGTSAIALSSFYALKEAVLKMDSFKLLSARIKAATTDTNEFSKAMGELVSISNRTGTSLEDNAHLYVRLRQGIRQLGGSYEDTIGIVKDVTNAIRISGATGLESSSALLQFSQAMVSGKLRGDELRSIMENAPRLGKQIADGLGVATGKLYDLGEAGLLTTDKVLIAMKKSSAEIAKEAESIPITVGLAWQKLSNNMLLELGKMDKQGDITKNIAKAIELIGSSISDLMSIFNSFGGASMLGGLLDTFNTLAWIVKQDTELFKRLGSAVDFIHDKLTNSIKSKDILDTESLITDVNDSISAIKNMKDEASVAVRSSFIEKLNGQLLKLDSQIAITKNKMSHMSDFSFVKAAYGLELKTMEAQRDKIVEGLRDKNGAKLDGTSNSLLNIKSALIKNTQSEFMGGILDKDVVNTVLSLGDAAKYVTSEFREANGGFAITAKMLNSVISANIDSAKTSEDLSLIINAVTDSIANLSGEAKTYANTLLDAAFKKQGELLEKELSNLTSYQSEAFKRANLIAKETIDNNEKILKSEKELQIVKAETNGIYKSQSRINALELEKTMSSLDGILKLYNMTNEQADRIANRKYSLSDNKSSIDKNTLESELYKNNKYYDNERDKLLTEQISKANKDRAQSGKEVANSIDKINEAQKRSTEQDVLNKKNIYTLAQIDSASKSISIANAEAHKKIDRDLNVEKLKNATETRDKLMSIQEQLLNNYKNYKQKVIDYDKQIVANRLQTGSDIRGIKRNGMTADEKVADMKKELSELQSLAGQFRNAGDLDSAKEYIQKQRDVVMGIYSSGVGSESDRSSFAINALRGIGNDTESILREQRDTASRAADETFKSYKNVSELITEVQGQIKELNSESLVQLKIDVNKDSLESVRNYISTYLDEQKFTVNVDGKITWSSSEGDKTDLSSLQALPDTPVYKAGGGLISGPGTSTSDSIPAYLSNGEYVVRAEAVQNWGIGFLDSINSGVPKFSNGGLAETSISTGGSVNNYINFPWGSERLPGSANEVDAFRAKLAREALKRGSR